MRGVTLLMERMDDFAKFQSTLPMRGVTVQAAVKETLKGFQSTLPMRGVTTGRLEVLPCRDISIHTPHAGSD